jgi:peptide/nickel transport system permease protein
VPVLLLVSVATFFLVELVPGDPAIQVLGPNGTAEDYVRIRASMGLDKPVVERYLNWLGNAVHGDLGRSLVPPIEPVKTRVARGLPINLELATIAMLISFVVSMPLALWSAYRAGSRFDRLVSATMFGLISIPSFLAGILLLLIFAINWRMFPVGQWVRPTDKGWPSNIKHALLPAITLSLNEIAVYTRLLRSDMISTLHEDYILAARAKGMPTRHILVREALRPSSFSLVTLAGISLGRLIGGTVIVEGVFSLPGVGRTIVDGATKSDFTLVQGGVLTIAIIYIFLSLVVDIVYGYLDPRVRRGRA